MSLNKESIFLISGEDVNDLNAIENKRVNPEVQNLLVVRFPFLKITHCWLFIFRLIDPPSY